MEVNISRLIQRLRFPLIVLVVYEHTLQADPAPIPSLAGSPALLLESVVHQLVTYLAVPTFFLISGYLFFLKFGGEKLWSYYLVQLQKRWRTLLLPYLLWFLIFVAVILFKAWLFPSSVAQDIYHTRLYQKSLFWLLVEGPLYYPFWYLVDLIKMVVISPLLYLAVKCLRLYALLALLLLAISNPCQVLGMEFGSLFFFTTGIYLAHHSIAEVHLSKSLFVASCLLFVACFALLVIGGGISDYFLIPYVIVRMIMLVTVIQAIAKKRDWFAKLSKFVFFIYATHAIYLMNIFEGIKIKLSQFASPMLSDTVRGLFFLVTPIIVILICITLYQLMEKLSPRLLSLLTGGRVIQHRTL